MKHLQQSAQGLALLILMCGLGGFALGVINRNRPSHQCGGVVISSRIDLPHESDGERTPSNWSYRNRIEHLRAKPAKSPADRIELLETLELWLTRDPVGCVNGLHEMGALALLEDESAELALRQAAAENPTVLMRMAGDVINPDLRDHLLLGAVRSTFATSPEVGLDLLGNIPQHLKVGLARELGKALGEEGDVSRMSNLLKHPNIDANIFEEAMKSWTKAHPAEALSFIDNSGDSIFQLQGITSKQQLLQRLATVAAPESMIRYLDQKPPSAQRSQLKIEMLGSLVARNPGRWKELTSSFKSASVVAQIAANAATKVVGESPDEALRLLDQIPGAYSRQIAAERVTQRFLYHDRRKPDRVFTWLRSLRDPAISQGVIDGLNESGMTIPEELKKLHRQEPTPYRGEGG